MKTKILPFKKAISAALFVLLLSVVGVENAFAQQQIIEGDLHYELNNDDLTAIVVAHKDNVGNDNNATGSLVIPPSVTYTDDNNVTRTYSVTTIASYAFYGSHGLTDLTLPNSLIIIGPCAFTYCNGLTGDLTIPNSVEYIDYEAFYGCSGLTGLTIGNSVTSIGIRAFYNCSGLTSLTIGNSVTSIGIRAFYNCSGLTGSLTIPNSVTTIEDYAFCNCSGLTNLTIGNSVISIGEGAFDRCSGLTGDLIIPNSVMTIGNYAFYNCSGLTGSLEIPNSVTSIGEYAFYNCSGLTGLTIGNSVTSIGEGAFDRCSGLTGDLIIPNSVMTIGNYAFYNCSGLTGSLEIPNSVTSIGEYAFYNCSGLTGLTIGNSVVSIERFTFRDCNGLTYLTIGNSVTSIGVCAFYKCSGLTGGLIIPNSVMTIGDHAFRDCNGLTYLTIGNSVTSIGVSAFDNCNSLVGGLTIPNSVMTIGNHAFRYCNGFNGGLTIGNSVTKIGNNAFYQCSGFTGNLVIPNSVDTIGVGAFIDCSGFSDTLVIGTGVRSMDISAFRRCSGITEIQYNATNCLMAGDGEKPVFNELPNLHKIVIGGNVEFLPDYLFANCYSTQFIRSYAEVPPVVNGANVFFGIDKEILASVPCGTLENYEEAAYWSEFTNYTESEYQLTVRANLDYLGRAVIVQQPTCNSSRCIVRAIPERGCRFVNWTCNGEEVTQISSYVFDLDEDKVMVANFETMRHFSGDGGTFVWSDPANWEPEGVPTDTMAVDIQANVIIDTDVSVGSVFNYSDKVLTVMPDVVLTVNQTLESSNASGIVIEDGGQIVHHNESALATIKKMVEAYNSTNDKWNLISFPLADSGHVASVGNMLSNDYDLYYYDEPTAYWMNQECAENSFDQLEAGKGYLYANNGGVSLSFAGEIENGSAIVTVPLSYTETAGNLKGFNLVGNPFVHNVTSYGSTNVAEGCFRLNEVKDNLIVSEVSETQPLHPAEGFFVKATDVGASITFNPGRSRGEAERKGFVNLELRENGKLIDRLVVKREGEPLEKLTLKENGTRLYAMQDRQEMAIVPCEGNEQPFSFKASKNGNYTINVNTDYMDFTYLHLIDNQTGNDVNLLVEPSYTFEAKSTDYASRFKLVFATGSSEDTESDSFAFLNSSGILTIYGIDGEATLQVVDMLGHILNSERFSGNYEKKLNVAPGVYMLRLINGDDVRTQKIVVR